MTTLRQVVSLTRSLRLGRTWRPCRRRVDREPDTPVGGSSGLLDMEVDRGGGRGEMRLSAQEQLARRGERRVVAAARNSLVFPGWPILSRHGSSLPPGIRADIGGSP